MLVGAVTDTVGEVGVGTEAVSLVGRSRGAAEVGRFGEQVADAVFLVWGSVEWQDAARGGENMEVIERGPMRSDVFAKVNWGIYLHRTGGGSCSPGRRRRPGGRRCWRKRQRSSFLLGNGIGMREIASGSSRVILIGEMTNVSMREE